MVAEGGRSDHHEQQEESEPGHVDRILGDEVGVAAACRKLGASE